MTCIKPLHIEQVSYKSYLPSKKIYFSWTTIWDFFGVPSLRISISMEKNFLFPCPEIAGNIFGSLKIHWNPPLKCFQFWKSHIVYFFLGPDSYKLVTFNALWTQFKMGNNRKMIDANQRFCFIYNLSYN